MEGDLEVKSYPAKNVNAPNPINPPVKILVNLFKLKSFCNPTSANKPKKNTGSMVI